MYITFAQYRDMGGSLDETAFNIYGYEAYIKIKTACFDRITEPSEAVKRCMVRLTELAADYAAQSKMPSSYSHDGLSESYNVRNQSEYEKEARDLIRAYLINEKSVIGVPLLFCGVSYNA